MATIYDVAKTAGVSPKTVSRVLNGDAPVGKETRAAVERAIARLGYVPSSAARTMRSNRSGLIGLITGAISVSPQMRELGGLPDLIILQGVQQALEAAGMTLLISDTGGRQERVPALMRTFAEHRVEGIIYVADHHQEVSLPPLPEGTQVVLANCFDRSGTPAVVPDDYDGQYRLVSDIIASGHRRIAYLTLPDVLTATGLRSAGYRAALEAAGIAPDPALVVEADVIDDDGTRSVGLLWQALERVLSLAEPPSVICCGNDRMAMRVYGMLRSRGFELPSGISVAGYDNYRAIAESLFPTLTTATLPYGRIGARAGNMLVELIGGRPAPTDLPERVRGEVVWRDSVTSNPART